MILHKNALPTATLLISPASNFDEPKLAIKLEGAVTPRKRLKIAGYAGLSIN